MELYVTDPIKIQRDKLKLKKNSEKSEQAYRG